MLFQVVEIDVALPPIFSLSFDRLTSTQFIVLTPFLPASGLFNINFYILDTTCLLGQLNSYQRQSLQLFARVSLDILDRL